MVVVAWGLGPGCGPGGPVQIATDTDTDTDTDTETGTTGNGDPTNPTNPTSPTEPRPTTAANGSNSGTADDTAAETNPPDTADTDECPVGTEGCLCDVGASCDEGLDCNDEGICEAPPACRPLDPEPHDDEGSAYEVEPLGCGDTMDLGLSQTLWAPETDWYTFSGNNGIVCTEQPGAIVMAIGLTTDVCVFVECEQGNTTGVMCGEGSSETSPEGRSGCCGEDGAQISSYTCIGGLGGNNANVWISVGSEERACADYALSYVF